ncbi:CD44 antigen isoform X2 [Phaenicophaeus curvirostris]|uniref:CD44 antigen isoform X2 n=1 Tax=Phaenicophaeus curvirostris TaxID=33595 RepID=UPI0037F0EF72
MVSFSLWATFGLCFLKLCLTETEFNISCRYGGVFHVERNGRYSLTLSEAVELCRALNSTLSTLEQLKKAHELGFETCRYGFVVGNVVIPRINPYHLCAANQTGVYKISANTTDRYDAYCYNATETRDKTCEPIERLDISFLNNQSEIVIDNTDGSRYNADGMRHSGESSTSGADDENVGSGSTQDTTPMDTSIRRSSPSYYGSATPVLELPDHSSGGSEKEIPRKESDYEVSSVSSDISLVTAADDSPEKDGGQYPASTGKIYPPLPSDNEPGQYTEVIMHPTDAPENEVLHRTTDSMNSPGDDSRLMITEPMDDVNQEKATNEPLAPSTLPGSGSEQAHTTEGSQANYIPEVFPDIEDHLNRLQTSLPTRSTSRKHGSQGPHKGHYESTTFPGETTTRNITSQANSAHLPEWLIIVAALVALALILAVCIAVNSRRRCGQKKKLVINNGKGAVEDRKSSGLNGDATKSQEMVHLVHKEQSNNRTGACDEFLTVNETQNHQDLDMKTGV